MCPAGFQSALPSLPPPWAFLYRGKLLPTSAGVALGFNVSGAIQLLTAATVR